MKKSTDLTEVPDTITVRELRTILFHVEDQEMTVKELRSRLFQVGDQDKEFAINAALFYILGVNDES